MGFNGKIYVHVQRCQFLMMIDKYDTSKDIDTHMYLANYVIFTQISEKKGIKHYGELEVTAILTEYQQFNDGPMPGNPVFVPINNE